MKNPNLSISTAARNKELLHAAYAQSAQGENMLFGELIADDVIFFKIGTTSWSKTYVGKEALRAMFQRLYALLEGPHIVEAQRFIADDDLVVVEAKGRSMTKTGKPYHNSYCMVFRLADGKIKEITEYCDTALIDAVL
jgi:hypothetical protein